MSFVCFRKHLTVHCVYIKYFFQEMHKQWRFIFTLYYNFLFSRYENLSLTIVDRLKEKSKASQLSLSTWSFSV